MKRILGGVVLAIAILIGPINVNAASSCSYSEQAELNEIAGNIKANYEAKREVVGTYQDIDDPTTTYDEYESSVVVSFLNITDDVYVKVTNDKNNNVQTFYKKDTNNGIVTLKTDAKEIINYTIEVYANKYACTGELLRTFYLITPMYNSYSELAACVDNPDFAYCQEFITTENVSFDDFYENYEDYKEEKEEQKEERKEKSTIEKIKEFYHNHNITINIVGSIIVVAGVATTVILVKKRRGRVL